MKYAVCDTSIHSARVRQGFHTPRLVRVAIAHAEQLGQVHGFGFQQAFVRFLVEESRSNSIVLVKAVRGFRLYSFRPYCKVEFSSKNVLSINRLYSCGGP